MTTLESIAQRFQRIAPAGLRWSLRVVDTRTEQLAVRDDVVQPLNLEEDRGAMVTVFERGGSGYAASADLSDAGLTRALERARAWAQASGGRSVADFDQAPLAATRGEYASPLQTAWDAIPLTEKFDTLRAACAGLNVSEKIVDRHAWLWHTQRDALYVTSAGAHNRQHFEFVVPMLSATANAGAQTQTRTLGGMTHCGQGGWEIVASSGFTTAAQTVADEALQLLAAPDCPSGTMDLLAAPDQMVLQIHESIGHPLELDRILGDERNFACTSFVTPDMFGRYQYGSALLNVTYDPTRPEQIASFAFDDEGLPATREYLIRDGILQRGLGGGTSQWRSGLPGVATARATNWNRPPMDRMSNLNVEPGASSLTDMIASVERGVLMRTNRSWSIDDSRNKFQFGCEFGQLIENGRLTQVVKNPNYRGISATFWRSLKAVGAADTFEVLGTPHCGKGEPNQVIDVGHAAPPCLFAAVDVFGGA